MKGIEKYAIKDGIDPVNIWECQQNHPELVVKDLKEEFGLTESQCDFVRYTLMKRGINKWLLNRRMFIDLKHQMKHKLQPIYEGEFSYKQLRKEYSKIYETMQNICKSPRWVEWGPHHKNMKKCDEEIVVKGRHC